MLNHQEHKGIFGRLPARQMVLILGCLLACISLATAIRSYYQPRKHSVYACYYLAGKSWGEQDSLYNKADMAQGIDLFRYYPTFAAAMTPWSWIPEAISGAAWRLTWGLALAGTLVAVFLGAAADVTPGRMVLAGTAWIACALTSMNNGQVNVPITVAMVVATLAAERGRSVFCGSLLAVAIITKIAPIAYAGLFALVLPWRMTLVCLGATGFLATFPFLLAPSDYAREQLNAWFELLRADQRHNWPIKDGYRDLWMLWRLTGLPTNREVYQVIQVVGAACLTVPIWMYRRTLPPGKLARLCYGLGTAWILLLGPSAESSTYILMGPWLAWAILEASRRQTGWIDLLLVAAGTSLILAALGGSLKFAAQWHALGWHPLAALFLVTWELANLHQYWSKTGIKVEAKPS